MVVKLGNIGLSEMIEIHLSCQPHRIPLTILDVVVSFFYPDIQDHADGQEIEIRHGQADLQTPEQEKRRGYFPGAGLSFFLESMSVTRLAPQSSMISGRIW